MSIREIIDNKNLVCVVTKITCPYSQLHSFSYTSIEVSQWSYCVESMLSVVERGNAMNLVICMPKKGPFAPLCESFLELLHLHSGRLSAGMRPPPTKCSLHISKYPVSISMKYYKKLTSEMLLLFVL